MTESTVGFVKIRREYRFSYRSYTANKDTDKVSKAKAPKSRYRCFSANPLDTLMRGVFFSHRESTLYIKACSDHSRQQSDSNAEKITSKTAKKQFDDTQDRLMLANITKEYCHRILQCLEEGQFVPSASWMLILHAFLASSGIQTNGDSGQKKKKNTSQSTSSSGEVGDLDDVYDGSLESTLHMPEHSVATVVPAFCQRQLKALTTVQTPFHAPLCTVISIIISSAF